MIYDIVLGTNSIYYVMEGSTRIGELCCDRAKNIWRFHYTAEWRNPPREQEAELWQMINSKMAILNVTSRLLHGKTNI